jgi:tRNA pseudouridine38-40 synthase
MKPIELYRTLELSLPFDIAVTRLDPCHADFDPRRDAVSRTYLYQVALRKCAFAKNYTWWPKRSLDPALAGSAWALFEGNHSMAAFADLEPKEDPRCQIYSCESKIASGVLLLRVTARFFLRRQVRRMAGAAVQCAIGGADVGQLRADLKSPSQSSALFWAEKSAPASGLFLESVNYHGDEKRRDLRPVIWT